MLDIDEMSTKQMHDLLQKVGHPYVVPMQYYERRPVAGTGAGVLRGNRAIKLTLADRFIIYAPVGNGGDRLFGQPASLTIWR